MPLYKNGVLAGAIGISGDGVDQDDLIAAAGGTGFARRRDSIRSDICAWRASAILNFPQPKLKVEEGSNPPLNEQMNSRFRAQARQLL